MDRGTYLEFEGRPAVRFQRTYRRPVETVWAALTDPDELARWFPSKVQMQQQVGGRVEFSGDPNLPASSSGTVLVIDPPRRLAYTWGGDELHFELEPDGAGGCVLTMINVLDDRAAAARNSAGWDVCLAELDKVVAGVRADGPHSDTAADWRSSYDAYLAAGMPAGAPVPGSPA